MKKACYAIRNPVLQKNKLAGAGDSNLFPYVLFLILYNSKGPACNALNHDLIFCKLIRSAGPAIQKNASRPLCKDCKHAWILTIQANMNKVVELTGESIL